MLEPLARVRELCWTLVPLETPAVIRRCPGCDARARFRSRDAFRVNANKRRLDVWLLYGCQTCDHTWNLTVVERAPPASLGAALHRFESNDPELAGELAFDHRLLEGRGHRVDRAVPFRVDGASPDRVRVRVRLVLAAPLRARLDAALAAGLGLSRARVRREVTVASGTPRWGRAIVDGEVLDLALARA